ncbi:type III ribulose-bisphosphate carboxylase [archaeon]|jgi:ribulose-bisphosphate carboxylase large chain|nr:type III ribulose-bisphosphate carboxylase [archaeon]
MQPQQFINLKYKPKGKDLICLFNVEPNKLTIKQAAATVALESSVGTWTDVHEKKYVNKIAAKVFSIKGNKIKIAYPQELFEKGNAPNILSSIAGNIFGMKAVKNLRLEDIQIPNDILNSFKGPKYGIKGIRKMMKIKSRPLVGTIVKPKLGLKTKDHTDIAYQAWQGGCDVVKDDENLSSQKFNKFENRLTKCLEVADKAKSQTGEEKAYLINVTAETNKMIERAQSVQDQGGKYVMIDIVTSGFSALQTLRDANFKMAIHAHRAMHAAFTRNKKHGISMMVLADLARLIGVDQLHIGTVVGKLQGSLKEVSEINQEIEKKTVKETQNRLQQDWKKIKSTLSVSSGGLHPGHVPFLIKHLGKDLVLQFGGGIHGHPKGTLRGAIAARQATQATMQNISLKQYSKDHLELKEALEYWK